MIGNSGLHSRGNSKALMYPAEIVIHEMKGYGMFEVFNLL